MSSPDLKFFCSVPSFEREEADTEPSESGFSDERQRCLGGDLLGVSGWFMELRHGNPRLPNLTSVPFYSVV